MPHELTAILNQMAIFVIIIFVGFIAGKTGILSAERQSGFSQLVVKIVLPAMIVTTLPTAGSRHDIAASLPVLVASGIIIILLGLMGFGVGKIFGLGRKTLGAHTAVTMFGNCGFMGMPLMAAVFGETGALYMSIFLIADQVLLWTAGETIVSISGRESGKRDAPAKNAFLSGMKNIITSPTIIALLIGLALILADIRPSGVVFDALKGLGDCSRYMALIYIGSTLINFKFKSVLKKPSLLALILTKMIIFPVIVYLVLGAFPLWFGGEKRLLLALASGLPTMLTISVMARAEGSDHDYAREATLFTNLVCVGTIPLISYIASLF